MRIRGLLVGVTFLFASACADDIPEVDNLRLAKSLRHAGFSSEKRGDIDEPESLWKSVANEREVCVVHNPSGKQPQFFVLINRKRDKSHIPYNSA